MESWNEICKLYCSLQCNPFNIDQNILKYTDIDVVTEIVFIRFSIDFLKWRKQYPIFCHDNSDLISQSFLIQMLSSSAVFCCNMITTSARESLNLCCRAKLSQFSMFFSSSSFFTLRSEISWSKASCLEAVVEDEAPLNMPLLNWVTNPEEVEGPGEEGQ